MFDALGVLALGLPACRSACGLHWFCGNTPYVHILRQGPDCVQLRDFGFTRLGLLYAWVVLGPSFYPWSLWSSCIDEGPCSVRVSRLLSFTGNCLTIDPFIYRLSCDVPVFVFSVRKIGIAPPPPLEFAMFFAACVRLPCGRL